MNVLRLYFKFVLRGKNTLALIATIFLLPAVCYAGMQSDLKKFFNNMGQTSNVTSSGSYKDQTGGHYTGGSLFVRSPARNIELMNLQMPNFRGGCGGIDLFTGGLSFINSKQLVETMKTIGSNAASYAFTLALQTVTPQIYNTINELNGLAQNINNMNINSCETAATLVGGVWPRTDASSKLLCSSMGTNMGDFTDWAQSRQACGAGGQRHDINSKKTGQYKDVLGDEFNIAWKAISKNPFLSSDAQLAEFFMSISGSIISVRVGSGKDATLRKHHLHSLINDPSLINALIFGQESATIYKCDQTSEDGCLKPRHQNISIGETNSLYGRVHSLLSSMSEKLRTDTPTTHQEQALVNSTIIPILKILAVESAFKAGGSPVRVTEFSEAIAHDILLQYLDQVLEVISQSIVNLQNVQIDAGIIEEFKTDIARARRIILERRNGVFQQMSTTLSLIEQTQQIEQKLHSMFVAMNRYK